MKSYLRLIIFLLIVIPIFGISTVNCQAPPPPPTLPSAENKDTLLKIDSTLEVTWNHKIYCNTLIGSEIFTASSNRGLALLDNNSLNDVKTTLKRLDSIGVKGVSFTINYPVLVNSFPHSSEYLIFYQQVVNEARKRGFKLLISCNAFFPDTTINKLNAGTFCLNMNNLRYKTEKTQMLQTIIDSLQPDYLTIENEPSFWLKSMGLNYSVDSVTSYVNYFISNLNKKQTKIGSGAGTWENIGYIKSFAKIQSLDYIDIHISPVYYNCFIRNSVRIDSLAKVNNKKVIIGNSWLYKANDAEVSYDTINVYDKIVSRNAFDTYITDDSLFIADVFKLSNILRTEYTSYYWTQFLFGYIHYIKETSDSLPPYKILGTAYPICINALNNEELTNPGRLLKTLLKQSCVNAVISPDKSQYPYGEIYPNPINDNLNIQLYLPHPEDVTVKIIDMNGSTVIKFNRTNLNNGINKFSIDTKLLNDGLYILMMQNSDFTIAKKLVISH